MSEKCQLLPFQTCIPARLQPPKRTPKSSRTGPLPAFNFVNGLLEAFSPAFLSPSNFPLCNTTVPSQPQSRVDLTNSARNWSGNCAGQRKFNAAQPHDEEIRCKAKK